MVVVAVITVVLIMPLVVQALQASFLSSGRGILNYTKKWALNSVPIFLFLSVVYNRVV